MPRKENPICSEFCPMRDIGSCANNKAIGFIAQKKGPEAGEDAFNALADAPDEIKIALCKQIQKGYIRR